MQPYAQLGALKNTSMQNCNQHCLRTDPKGRTLQNVQLFYFGYVQIQVLIMIYVYEFYLEVKSCIKHNNVCFIATYGMHLKAETKYRSNTILLKTNQSRNKLL